MTLLRRHDAARPRSVLHLNVDVGCIEARTLVHVGRILGARPCDRLPARAEIRITKALSHGNFIRIRLYRPDPWY